MPHLLQVCNVGRIVGGTAACAWTVTRSLPDWRHTVVFRSGISPETRRVFARCELLRWDHVTSAHIEDVGPDIVLLHNTPAGRCERLSVPTVQYLHSRIGPAPADLTIVCSRWLAERLGLPAGCVVHQAVPRPLFVGQAFQPDRGASSTLRSREQSRQAGKPDLRVGRLCTPARKKWPHEVVPFYERLAAQFPDVAWEFIGCPAALQHELFDVCRGNANFFPASWAARSRLWHWDALLYHNPRVTESFGRTAAEAMRAGCIPIVDNRGGFAEQVAGGCGFLCDSVADFTSAVAVIQSPATRLSMSHRCRAHADGAFSLRGFRERLLGVFGRAKSGREFDSMVS